MGTSHRESDLGQFTVMREQQEQGMAHKSNTENKLWWLMIKRKSKSRTLSFKTSPPKYMHVLGTWHTRVRAAYISQVFQDNWYCSSFHSLFLRAIE